jgi:hypothetical protein
MTTEQATIEATGKRLRPFRCDSPECLAADYWRKTCFFLDIDAPDSHQCPKCKSTEHLTRLEIIHLLVPDPAGEIDGSNLQPHKAFSIACGRKRAKVKHLTAEPVACTCYDCSQTIKDTEAEEEE